MGSADWMQRNLDHRVELVFPIEDPDLQKRAFDIVQTMLNDTINTRLLQNVLPILTLINVVKLHLTLNMNLACMPKKQFPNWKLWMRANHIRQSEELI